MKRGDPVYVRLEVVEKDGRTRVWCRGIFSEREEAAHLPRLEGCIAVNVVGRFLDLEDDGAPGVFSL